MSAKYLLPCTCGQSVTVEPRQAGESIACACGTVLSVPTMLQMATLEPALDDTAQPQSAPPQWGAKDRMALLGIVLLVVAVVGALFLLANRPIFPYEVLDLEGIRQNMQQMPVWRTWEIWEQLKLGLDSSTDQWYQDAMTRFYIWLGVVVVVAAAGAALLAVGKSDVLVRQRPKSGLANAR